MKKKVIKAHKGFAHVPKPSASKAKGTAGATPRPKRRMIGLPQKFRGTTSKRQAELNNLRLDRAPNIEQVRAMFGTSNLSPQELKIIQETKKATRNVKPTSFTPKQIKAQRDAYERQRKGLPPARDPRTDNYRDDRTPRRPTAPVLKAPAPVRRAPAIQEPKVVMQPKPTGNPFKKGSHNYEVYEGRGGRPSAPVKELPNKGRGKNQRYAPKPIIPKPIMRVQAPPPPKLLQPRTMKQGGYVSRAKYGQVNNLKKGK